MKNKGNFAQKQNRSSWILLAPAMVLILMFSIYPAVKALITSFQTGAGLNMQWAGFENYARVFKDKTFIQSLKNCIVYLIIQVPIMLVLALVLASALNDRKLKCRGLFRTAVFLPCATSLVSYAIIFRSLFATDGFINSILVNLGVLDQPFNFLSNATAAKAIIIIALIWRWTGYNMVFYLAGLQSIDYSVYEAAKIDGATPFQTFTRITVPLLKPTILMTAIMSTNGTLQLFDESVNLTFGGPGTSTMTMSHYIYNQAFMGVPNFGYTSAMAFIILIMVAILAFVQLKVGEKDE
ncbi:MAG: sugar ABC transporter permease [Lachnospiraceae bacterium]|nr:sugar ABC transporter permease [Lachnospiraceae bacterium]